MKEIRAKLGIENNIRIESGPLPIFWFHGIPSLGWMENEQFLIPMGIITEYDEVKRLWPQERAIEHYIAWSQGSEIVPSIGGWRGGEAYTVTDMDAWRSWFKSQAATGVICMERLQWGPGKCPRAAFYLYTNPYSRYACTRAGSECPKCPKMVPITMAQAGDIQDCTTAFQVCYTKSPYTAYVSECALFD